MDWRTLFLSPQGRIGQRDFWIGFAILFVAGLVLGMIPIIGQLIGLVLIYFNVCVFVKRLHDFGKTGWLYLVPFAATIVLATAAAVMGGLSAASFSESDGAGVASAVAALGLFGLLIFAVNLAFLLWVGLSKSDPGENRFGPPPALLTRSMA